MSSTESISAQLKVKTILVVLGIFIAGAVSGVGFDRWARPDRRPPMPIHFFIERLNLSPEQEERANAVIEAHRGEVEAVFQEGFPKIAAVNAKIEAELREFLTPEQRTALDRLIAEGPRHRHMGPPGMMHHRRDDRFGSEAPPPPPPSMPTSTGAKP